MDQVAITTINTLLEEANNRVLHAISQETENGDPAVACECYCRAVELILVCLNTLNNNTGNPAGGGLTDQTTTAFLCSKLKEKLTAYTERAQLLLTVIEEEDVSAVEAVVPQQVAAPCLPEKTAAPLPPPGPFETRAAHVAVPAAPAAPPIPVAPMPVVPAAVTPVVPASVVPSAAPRADVLQTTTEPTKRAPVPPAPAAAPIPVVSPPTTAALPLKHGSAGDASLGAATTIDRLMELRLPLSSPKGTNGADDDDGGDVIDAFAHLHVPSGAPSEGHFNALDALRVPDGSEGSAVTVFRTHHQHSASQRNTTHHDPSALPNNVQQSHANTLCLTEADVMAAAAAIEAKRGRNIDYDSPVTDPPGAVVPASKTKEAIDTEVPNKAEPQPSPPSKCNVETENVSVDQTTVASTDKRDEGMPGAESGEDAQDVEPVD